ncbi:MAG: lysine 2,3-aminomutase [Planctomycetota bacterium]|jgi:KamA family protein|nr:lysine 2,3-aminomutase [Planctomycetota bacterium]MDP6762427.1 lysine 2,3-aminomutase [Planctomycetota bacterium]MDP6988726.1 lysine 2,3-aminomutase [Planctomycetota bacterium]
MKDQPALPDRAWPRAEGSWGRSLRIFTERDIERIPALQRLPREQRFAMRVVARVLPFRVNEYVIEELIDWERVPTDPVFQLTFPQPGMLDPADFERVAHALRRDLPRPEVDALAHEIRAGLNPHPSGQQELNVPRLDGLPLDGMQHKYRETVLFFPSQGQTCHSYCTFCFRWAQFVGDQDLRFASREAQTLHTYLKQQREVTDLLITGGDPMVMKARHMERYLEPLLGPGLEHVRNVRIGTKSLSFWPQRYVEDADADELLGLLERLVEGGRHVALMIHQNHAQELRTPMAEEAIRRVRETGAVIRSQSPVLAHVNDDAASWSELWRRQVRLGIVPYYMFVERDTGARRYFELPLARAFEIYSAAMANVSGLARTARGPSMSAAPGKVEVNGVSEIAGERVFSLRFLQARDPAWLHRPFHATFDPTATWLDDLKPAWGEESFFWEEDFAAFRRRREMHSMTAVADGCEA